MTSSRLSLLLVGFVVGVAHTANAQYWPNYYHSSTYGESVARGAADVIRSAGTYNVRNSEAAKNWADAQSKAYDNRVKAAQTYMEVQNMKEAYRQSRKRPRPTSEQLFRMAKMEVPKPLSSTQLDPVTGKINWPLELTASDYEPARARVETLFADRAKAAGKVNLDQYHAIHEALDDMHEVLNRRLSEKKVFPQDWTAANRFLKQLRQAIKS